MTNPESRDTILGEREGILNDDEDDTGDAISALMTSRDGMLFAIGIIPEKQPQDVPILSMNAIHRKLKPPQPHKVNITNESNKR